MKEISDFVMNLYSLTEIKIIAFSGILGGIIAKSLGGFDGQITALFILVMVDYFTGMFAAWQNGKIWSKAGYKGIMKKISIFAAISFAVLVDCSLKTDTFRYMAISGFAIMEAISILENADRGGWGGFIPPFIRGRLVELRKSNVDKFENMNQ